MFETDHLNTPRVVKSSGGTIVWQWDSDPFGATPRNEDPQGHRVLPFASFGMNRA